jgi:hypothetical protein
MNKTRPGLVIVVTLLMMLVYATVDAQGINRAKRKSFFTINPTLRAEVLAQEAVKEEEDLLSWPVVSDMLPLDGLNRHTPEPERWNEIAILGVTISLSRMVREQNPALGDLAAGDDEVAIREFWSRLFQGALRQEDWAEMGGVLQPQLNLGITF